MNIAKAKEHEYLKLLNRLVNQKKNEFAKLERLRSKRSSLENTMNKLEYKIMETECEIHTIERGMNRIWKGGARFGGNIGNQSPTKEDLVLRLSERMQFDYGFVEIALLVKNAVKKGIDEIDCRRIIDDFIYDGILYKIKPGFARFVGNWPSCSPMRDEMPKGHRSPKPRKGG